MVFNFDWWFGSAYHCRIDEAKHRCALEHFPDLKSEQAEKDKKCKSFIEELEARTIVYLRDGFSYEIKDIIKQSITTTLTFECVAADEAYKVGCFVVTVPFDEIVRVEIFAVHPREKPEDMPSIKGFASGKGPQPPMRPEERPGRGEFQE